MASNEFGGNLYSTQRDMLDAIASEWLTAGGKNSESDVQGFLATNSDAELAAECIGGWGLDSVIYDDPDAESHMNAQDYAAADLADAFGRLRQMRRVTIGVDEDENEEV